MIRTLMVAALLAGPAMADSGPARCAPRAEQVEVLTERFKESPVGIGLSEQGVVEMWANPETGTWTVTITTPDGMLCGIIAGLAFEAYEPPKPGITG